MFASIGLIIELLKLSVKDFTALFRLFPEIFGPKHASCPPSWISSWAHYMTSQVG